MNSSNLSIGGAVVFWRLAKSTNRSQVEEGLDRLGLKDYCPEARNDLSCLRAVLDDVYLPENPKEQRYVFRPIKNGVKGFAVVCERPKEHKGAGDEWGEVVATAGFDKDGDLVLDPWNSEKHTAIKSGMEGARNWLTAAAVGKALIELAEKECDAVALRPTGGVYWVRDSHLDTWTAIADVFETASAREDEKGEPAAPNSVYVLRVVADEQMVRAVGDALTSEVELALANIEAEIQSGGLGEQACLSRVKKTGELSAKVNRYESAFGEPMSALTAAVDRVGAAVAMAALQQSAANSEPVTAAA